MGLHIIFYATALWHGGSGGLCRFSQWNTQILQYDVENFVKLCIRISVVTVIEIGTETAVFFPAKPNRTETEVLCLSVDGFANGAALALPWTLTACCDSSRRACYRRDRRRSAAVMRSTTPTCDGGGDVWHIWMDGQWGLGNADGPSETN